MRDRARIARLALVAGVLLLGASRIACAAKLPDWARAIADSAPAIPEGSPEHPTRILFDEVRITFDDHGNETTRWRTATQILGSQVSSLKRQGFSFQEGARLKTYRGWHLPEGDKARRAYSDPLEIAVGDNFLDDIKSRSVSVGGVGRGSLVFFEFEVEETPIDLSVVHWFGNDDETLLERFEVDTPAPGWTVKSDWLRHAGAAPVVEANTWKWEMQNAPAPEPEPMGPGSEERMPMLLVSVVPPPGSGVKPLVFGDWTAYAAWWEGLAKGRDAVTPEVEFAAKRAVAEAGGSGFFDTVPALSRFVRDGVRYVAKEIGIGGYQPRAAGQVLDQQFGDCKDKATLLRALLKVQGIPSFPVLVNATYDDTVSIVVPSLRSFNHLIVAVPVPVGTEIPARYASAVADAGELGRLFFVDTTDEYASIGSIPSYLAGKKAFVPAGAKSGLVTIPAGTPAENRIERAFAAEVHPDGSIEIDTTWRYMGAAAEYARSSHRSSFDARRKEAERVLLSVFVDGEPKAYKAEAESADGAYVEKMTWHVPPPMHGTLKEVPLFVGASYALPRTSVSAKRKTAVRYGYPLTQVYETTLKGAPNPAGLPHPEKREGNGWSIVSSASQDGDKVQARWEMVLSKSRYEVDALADLKKLWLAISTTGSAVLLLTDPAKP
jgi:hypothetical protein